MSDRSSRLPPLDTRHPALVLGVEHPRGLAVLRSLSGAGVDVHVVDRFTCSPGLHSRLPRSAHLLDTDDHAETLSFLEAMKGVDRAVLIPTSDHYLELVATNRPRLAERFTLTTPAWEVLEPVIDKASLYRLAASVPVATPTFYRPDSLEDMDDVLSRLDFERRAYVFSLPPSSVEPADAESFRFTLPAGADRPSASRTAADLFSRAGMLPMIQEVVPGTAQHCIGVVMLVDDHSRPVGWRAVRRVKLFPYFQASGSTYGGNIHCESVHDDEAVAAAAALIARAKLTGVVTVEFRRDPSDGRLILMKVDPRFVGMAGLCTALGFDAPAMLYRMSTGQSVAVSSAYEDGLSWVWELPYLHALLRSRGRAWRQIPGALHALRRATILPVWSAADPWPLVWNAVGGARSQVRKRFARERQRRQQIHRDVARA